MKKRNVDFLIAAILPLACSGFAVHAQEQSLEPVQVQQAKQLATLKSQLAELKAKWNADENMMQRRSAALQERRESLSQTNEGLRANIAKLETRKKLLQTEKKELDDQARELSQAVAVALDEALNTLETSFSACSKLNALPKSAFVKPEAGNVNELIDEYAETVIDAVRFASSIHSCSAILDAPDSRRLQMDVLLVGTNLAFAVAPDGSQAAAAFRRQGSWQWQWHSAKLAKAITQALKIAKNEVSPAIIEIPMPSRPDTSQ